MNTLTKKISQIDLNDGSSGLGSQGGTSKTTFTRISRTDSANTTGFSNTVRSNAPAGGPTRTAPAPGKLKSTSSNQSLRALAAAKGVASSSSTSTRVASQPLTTNKTNQPQQQSSRAPVLNTKGSQSSLRSVPYASATERSQQQRSGTTNSVASNYTSSATDFKPKTAVEAAVSLDLGSYDGGFDPENDKRGSAVFGEAAELLALDSSTSAYVEPDSFYAFRPTER